MTTLGRQMLLLCVFASVSQSIAQNKTDTVNTLQSKAAKVFIDCQSCDEAYIRTEISFVNYVRDSKEADVHVLMTQQSTASGGHEYTLTLIGQHGFANMNDTLVYVSKQSETDDIIRKGLVRVLKTGLLRYAMHTPFADFLSVNYEKGSESKDVADRWDYWVFRFTFNTVLNGEQQHSNDNLYGSVTASRVTNDWKINLSVNGSYNEDNYEVLQSDPDTSYNIFTIRRSQYFNGLVVKSIDDHWSAGLGGTVGASTYSNTAYSINLSPALEYDLFPYSQSTRQQLRFTYRVGYNAVKYNDSTIYDKIDESYASQSLAIALDLKQTWGTISMSVSGQQYPGDFRNHGRPLDKQISWGLFGGATWRVFEGLTLNLFAQYSAVHDQFGLLKGGASRDDVLLQRRQLETSYSYFASIGFSYTFGSIYNNIVNPRMGSDSGGGITITMN